jgi:hypothetical protein
MNWLPFSVGVVAIIVFGWIILAARAECKKQNWKNPDKKLF